MKQQKLVDLRAAYKALCAEKGAAPSFEDVYVRAGVKRPTAYRIFKKEFDAAVSGRKASGVAARSASDQNDTRSAYRKLTAKLANQIQALELELELARRKQREDDARAGGGAVVPFPTAR